MKRKSKPKTKKNNIDSDQSQQFQELPQSEPENSKQYVKAQRKMKNTKKASKKNIKNQQDQDNEVLDIHHGDSFIREHVRPGFLKRWDGQSNTLELTQKELDGMSPMLKVYWQYKSKNMNCIIFAQIGKVQFFAFEDDAIRCHQIFKKKLKKFSCYLMVNFWSKQIELAKIQLFQRRIPVLMLNQIYDQQYKRVNGIFKRQITEVITPSIYLTMQPKKFRQRMMLAIFIQDNKCGAACVDIQTNHFYLQNYEQEKSGIDHHIRRLINKYRPVQLLVQRKDNIIKKIAKQICQPYIIQMAPYQGRILDIIQLMKQVSEEDFFRRMAMLYKKEEVKQDKQFSLYSIVKVLSLLLGYLKNFGLQAKIFGQGIFQICDFQASKLKPMFDAQVYENLQVFNLKDQQDSFGKPGTLYHYMNHCVTQSGQKLLKKWIDQPLRTPQQISKRQIAVQNIMQNEAKILQIHKQLLRFERLQKKLGNIYHWALKSSEQGKIILTKQLKFDKQYNQNKNPAVIRIKQIFDVLKILLNVQTFFKKMSEQDITSSLLKKNCRVQDAGDLYHIKRIQLEKIEGLPAIDNLIAQISNKINIDPQSGLIQPAQGISEVFDMQKQNVNRISDELDQLLSKWKKTLGVSKINYVSVRARNQIQVMLSEVKDKKFKQLIFSSQTSKMIRYVNPDVQNLTQQLVAHQQAIALAYQPFSAMMVKQFCAHKHIWDIYISALSKIDVLMSIAKASLQMQPRCLPSFQQNGIQIINGYHPGLLQLKNRDKIIGNTIKLDKDKRILLLTGPNMGGKSTLLRQTCLLAILAQIGSFVPCQKYNCIIFDQIFCRIGASDRVIEGKSTFYVQLQETKRIIDQATPNSLAIIDELGRGTSTYDGMALASSVLKYISQQIGCYTLFSTHYLPLTKYCMNQQTVCGRMGYKFNKQTKQIQFTYQLEQGIAQKSFANQVAAKVGLSKQSLQIAERKAQQISIKSQKKKLMTNKQRDKLNIKKVYQFLEQAANL